MIILLIVGCVVAALGVPIAALGVAVARMQDAGGHCAYRRPRAAVILALSAWRALRPGTAPATWDQIRAGMGKPSPEGIVTEAEVREEWERLADERGTPIPGELPAGEWPADWPDLRIPMSPDPAQVPFTGWRVPDGHRLPGGRGLMFARTPYPTAADPVTPAQTDDDPPWDVSTRQQPAIDAPVYGQAPVATVLEAQRAYVLALGPDGCEET